MFVNFTNHPSENWDQNQLDASMAYGEIVDVPFPNVDVTYNEDEVRVLAENAVAEIMALNPTCVLCQGEFNLAYLVISILIEKGIPVVAACTERVVEEHREGGIYKKVSQFKFVKYRRFE